jgi:hypothetical protein
VFGIGYQEPPTLSVMGQCGDTRHLACRTGFDTVSGLGSPGVLQVVRVQAEAGRGDLTSARPACLRQRARDPPGSRAPRRQSWRPVMAMNTAPGSSVCAGPGRSGPAA